MSAWVEWIITTAWVKIPPAGYTSPWWLVFSVQACYSQTKTSHYLTPIVTSKCDVTLVCPWRFDFMHWFYNIVTNTWLPVCVDLCSLKPVISLTEILLYLVHPGWPFQPCLCPRCILTPLVFLKLDCFFFPRSLDRKWPSCETGTNTELQKVRYTTRHFILKPVYI